MKKKVRRKVAIVFMMMMLIAELMPIGSNVANAQSLGVGHVAITKIAAGAYHSLALKADGSVVAWGSNNHGQATVPKAAKSGVVAITAGYYHSLALKSDGSVVAWGYNNHGQTTVPTAAQSGVVAIAAGNYHNLALKSDGSVVAWGYNYNGQATVPTAAKSGVMAIAAGSNHSLALKSDGSVVAWGNNNDGQATVPTAAQSGVAAIAAGAFHSLALKSDGSVIAWGDNTYGQSTIPTAAQSGVVAIAAENDHSLALKSDGSVVAWGNNYSGLENVPNSAQSGVVAIAAGYNHSLALKSDGSVVAWGYNGSGQTSVPAGISNPVKGSQIAAGENHLLALKSDGSVVAWGENFYGEANVPTAAQSGVAAIAAGAFHSLALKSDGSVIAWGDNTYGQTTVPSAAQSGVVAIAAGYSYSLALKSDGRVIVWGDNTYGQTSVPSAAQSGVVAIAAGNYHSLALKSDGSVIAWGDNTYGQTTVPSAAQSGVVAIAAGGNHSLALKSDGSVIAWGDNHYSQTTVPSAAQSGVVAIAAGLYHSLALKSDGSVVAWGSNNDGQTTIPSAAQSGVAAIAAGAFNSVVLKSDGSVVVWGSNYYHQKYVPGSADLRSLTLDAGAISPAFDPTVTSYTYYVGSSVTSVNMTATLADAMDDDVYINGQKETSGSAISVPINGVSTAIPIKVEPYLLTGKTYTLTVKNDSTAPTVSFGTNGDENYAKSVTTSVYVTDAESGVDTSTFQYVWTQSTSTPGSGTTWTAFTSGDTISKSGVDGDWYLHIQAKDNLGNTANVATSRFRLDNSTPTVTVQLKKQDNSTYASGDWTNQTVSASVYAADGLSGTGAIQYSLDNGNTWQTYGTSLSFKTDGTHTLEVKATDKAGNTSSIVSQSINITRSGLVLDVTMKNADNTSYTSGDWTNQSVTASVYANQSTSGVTITSTMYSLDGGATWQSYTSPIVLSSAGTYTLDAKVNDSAGNTLTSSNNIRIDQTAPTVSFGTNGNEIYAHTASTTVSVSDSDSGLDTSSLQYVWTDSASTPGGSSTWTNLLNGDTLSKSGVNGDWYLHIQAKDMAGNTVNKVSSRFRLKQITKSSTVIIEKNNSGGVSMVVNPSLIKKITRSDGTVVEQVTLNTNTMDQALNLLKSTEKPHITIAINDTERVVQVQLPASSIVEAAKSFQGAIIEVQLNGSSYQLAIQALDLKQMAKQLGVDLKDLKVNVTIERVNQQTQKEIQQIATTNGLKLSSSVIDFKVTVEANGQTKEIADFGGTYMARSIVPNANTTNNNLIGVLYDPATKTFRFVPSESGTRSDGKQEMVMNVPHNSMYAVVEVQPKTFTDLNGHWAKADIELLASKLIVKGVTKEQFAPNANITRAELTTLLVRALGISTVQGNQSAGFTDVASNDWYASAIEAAVKAGLIHGYKDGTFKPNQPISREELTVLIDRAIQFVQKSSDSGKVDAANVLSSFTDQENIANWAKQDAAYLVQAGLVHGRSTDQFAPKAHTTRAEAAVLLERLLKQLHFIN